MSDTIACQIDQTAPDDSDAAAFDPGPGKHVLFFGDPMCSWCWGFAPALRKIQASIHGRAQFHVIMGGLRPGTAEPWDAKMREYIANHWHHVEDATGQAFDFSRFDDETFVYDTEPACRALVAVRAMAAERAPAYYESLQRAFYAESRDITDPVVLTDLAEDQNLGRTAFLNLFTGNRARDLVAHDFKRTRAFGVSGFPTVVCAEDGQYAVLSPGYRPFSALKPSLDEWLNA